MDKCQTCVFYKQHLLKSSTCTRISNINLLTKRNTPFKIPAAFKICKGYFFEKKKCDEYIFEGDMYMWVVPTSDEDF